MNKLTLKDNTVSYCGCVREPYFPLRTACLLSYGRDKYFWVCIITLLYCKYLHADFEMPPKLQRASLTFRIDHLRDNNGGLWCFISTRGEYSCSLQNKHKNNLFWGEVRWGEVSWGEVSWGEVSWGEGYFYNANTESSSAGTSPDVFFPSLRSL